MSSKLNFYPVKSEIYKPLILAANLLILLGQPNATVDGAAKNAVINAYYEASVVFYNVMMSNIDTDKISSSSSSTSLIDVANNVIYNTLVIGVINFDVQNKDLSLFNLYNTYKVLDINLDLSTQKTIRDNTKKLTKNQLFIYTGAYIYKLLADKIEC